jgi:hypothetical protein
VARGAYLRNQASGHGLRTKRELILGIHVENADRRPAESRLCKNVNAAPLKVIFPTLSSRMEKLRDLIRLRINACQIRALVQIKSMQASARLSRSSLPP